MAGLCGPRILLVWVGIIGLVYTNVQANTTPMITTTTPDKPTPPTTAPPTMAPPTTARPTTARPTTASPKTASPKTPSPKTPSPKTPSPKTAFLRTTPDTTKATGTPPSTPPTPPPQCSYNVIPIPFGLRVEVNSSTAGIFFITLNEEVHTKNTTGMSKLKSSHEFKHLKPCTFYKHNVTFEDNGGQKIICRGTESPTKTSVMRYAEIQNYTNISGSLCYSSEWDISHSLSTLNRTPNEWVKKDNKTCIKINNNDICLDLNITFTSGDCVNSSFHRNEVIGVVFLTVNETNFIPGKGLPASIKDELPKNCKDLTINYTCSEKNQKGKNDYKKLSALEPFTEYNCIGHIKNKDVEIKKTTSILINIDCDLTLNQIKMSEKSSQIDINWNTSSLDCKGLAKLPGLSYNCYCWSQKKIPLKGTVNKTPTGGSCVIPELEPSTTYNCSVQPTYNRKPVGWKRDRQLTTSDANDNKALIGILVFLIILTSVALLFVVYKIYLLKSRESHDLNENLMLISATTDEGCLLPVEPIAAELLLESYRTKFADEGRLFLDEFQSIPRVFARYTMKEAKKACNAIKNRYVDILPYDYQRVQLTTGNGEAGWDYINASFIDGYKDSKKYIAAQGPKEETVCDFWRMIWEQQSSIIVMVTRCEEGNRVKCAQYWPSSDQKTQLFQEFIVKLSSEDRCPDYTIRHLSLANKKEKNSEREVTHIQFLSWPDHGVPEEAHLLLKLRRRVNAFKNFFSGPIVVHCSAGVGRTGTYIAIDAMMECMEAEGKVDIYGYVVKLRKQRCLMVQVEAQYILIHQALLEHNQFGDTEITLPELHNALSMLKQKNSGNETTLMEDEFERLPTYRSWRTCNTGLKEENKKKNRFSSVIPYDYNRVMVKNHEGPSHDSDPSEQEEDEDETSDEEDDDTTKYINASHINGYWGPRSFIAAQTPLPNTMADFCSMVYQKKVSTIVMLSDCSEEDKESDCVYWDKHTKSIGEFEVEVLNTTTSPTFISRNMLIRHDTRKEGRSVKHFQFLKWGDRELPEKPQDLTDMIMAVKQSWRRSKSQSSTPVVVHCSDGSSKSGTFCALWNMLDSAENEKLVDVFQLAKTLHMERQGMLLTLEQYQFLYDALEDFYPVQNGEMKAAEDPAADSLLIMNETASAEQPASTTSNGQQGAAPPDSTPTATPPVEDSNAPRATVEA